MSELRTLARKYAEKFDNPEAAVEALRNDVMALLDGEQDQAVLDAISEGCGSAVYQIRHAERERTKQRFLPGNANRPSSVMSGVSDAIGASILDQWILDDGRKLGDVLGTELRDFAANDRGKARGFIENATFYERIAAIAGNKRVRDAVKPDKAEKLWREVRGDEPTAKVAAKPKRPIKGAPGVAAVA